MQAVTELTEAKSINKDKFSKCSNIWVVFPEQTHTSDNRQTEAKADSFFETWSSLWADVAAGRAGNETNNELNLEVCCPSPAVHCLCVSLYLTFNKLNKLLSNYIPLSGFFFAREARPFFLVAFLSTSSVLTSCTLLCLQCWWEVWCHVPYKCASQCFRSLPVHPTWWDIHCLLIF